MHKDWEDVVRKTTQGRWGDDARIHLLSEQMFAHKDRQLDGWKTLCAWMTAGWAATLGLLFYYGR